MSSSVPDFLLNTSNKPKLPKRRASSLQQIVAGQQRLPPPSRPPPSPATLGRSRSAPASFDASSSSSAGAASPSPSPSRAARSRPQRRAVSLRPQRSAPAAPPGSAAARLGAAALAALSSRGHFDEARAVWAVRLDGATGRWCYEDTVSGVKRWDSRAAASVANGARSNVKQTATWNEVHDAHRDVVENLVGFRGSGSGGASAAPKKKSEEWRAAARAVARWIESSAARAVCPPIDVAASMLRWPAFFAIRGGGGGDDFSAAAAGPAATTATFAAAAAAAAAASPSSRRRTSGEQQRRVSGASSEIVVRVHISPTAEPLDIEIDGASTTAMDLVKTALAKASTLLPTQFRGASSMASDYILKLAGREDYLIYPDRRLNEYASVARMMSSFMHAPPLFALVALSSEELRQVAALRAWRKAAETRRSVRRREAHAARGGANAEAEVEAGGIDYESFDAPRSTVTRRASAALNVDTSILDLVGTPRRTAKRTAPRWPFRIRLLRVSSLTDDALQLGGALARCTGVWLSLALEFNGRRLVCHRTGEEAVADTRFLCRCSGGEPHSGAGASKCACAPTLLPVESPLRFPTRKWLTFRHFNLFDLPPETRIVITLCGRFTNKRGRGEAEVRTIASATVALVNYRGELVAGAQTAVLQARGLDQRAATSVSASSATVEFELDEFVVSGAAASLSQSLGVRASCSLAGARAAARTAAARDASGQGPRRDSLRDDAALAATSPTQTIVPTSMLGPWLLQRASQNGSSRRTSLKQDGGGVAAERRASLVVDEEVSKSRLRKLLREFQTCEHWSSFTLADRPVVWRHREYLAAISTGTVGGVVSEGDQAALPLLLLSVDWTDANAAQEARVLMLRMAAPDTSHALELLSSRFSDRAVRELAVATLGRLSDAALCNILLQLVQALKVELRHDSMLTRMLLRRALCAPHSVGHTLFWLLRSEMHSPDCRERFGLLLSAYALHARSHVEILAPQLAVNAALERVALGVLARDSEERTAWVQSQLAELALRLPAGGFTLPLSPRMKVSGIDCSRSKVMDSKQAPIWVSFLNADRTGGEKDKIISIIFKCGDDLRQDALTLSILGSMEQTWVVNGLPLMMKLYGCVSTGLDVGMIEVVPSSATTAAIQASEAGTLRGAFAKNPIRSWLDRQCVDDDERLAARERFMRSCAAYCVATAVIGLGDRHPSNIMVTKRGELFHIDFGHFLGNFKSKMGVKRERSPFVFTPQMLGVLGKELSDDVPQRFLLLCEDAFNQLRRNAHLLLALFILMVPAGMPELREASDVGYMHRMLLLHLDDAEAGQEFRGMVTASLKDTFRQIDNAIHQYVHRV